MHAINNRDPPTKTGIYKNDYYLCKLFSIYTQFQLLILHINLISKELKKIFFKFLCFALRFQIALT